MVCTLSRPFHPPPQKIFSNYNSQVGSPRYPPPTNRVLREKQIDLKIGIEWKIETELEIGIESEYTRTRIES